MCRFRRPALALDEGPLGMVFSYESNDNFHDFGWHWHGLDKIVASIGERLSFGRVSRYGKDLIWPLRSNGLQDNP
jgi:hypothetical protein